MTLRELAAWQWDGYRQYHASRANLLLHIVVVPLFWLGTLGVMAMVVHGRWLPGLIGGLAMVVSVALQGRGHAMEAVPPVPFSGPGNAVARILLEQWVSFPRFVVSGGWWRALRQSA